MSNQPIHQKHFRWDADDLILQLRVSPRASRDAVNGLMGDRLKVSITAPPVDGKANTHLEKYIASRFGIPQSRVAVERGFTGKNKTVRIVAPDASLLFSGNKFLKAAISFRRVTNFT